MHRMTKLALLAALTLAAPLNAHAFGMYQTSLANYYQLPSSSPLIDCNTCHTPAGTSTFNSYGQELKTNIGQGIDAALAIADPKDSDADGFANGVEVRAGTFPGDPNSFPATPAPAPAIAVSPTSLSFGTVNVGSSAQQTVTVSNGGTADLSVSAAAPCAGTSAEFSASPAGPFTVAAKGSTTVTVTYAPADATADTGCIAIASNDKANATVNVALSGTGVVVATPVADVDITRFSVAKRLDVSRGGTTQPKVAVVNAGTVAVAAGDVTVSIEAKDASGAVVYTASDSRLALAPGATGKLSFPVFTPATPGEITWTVTVADAAPDADVATAVTKIVP